jgi:vesicle coat complex subunit
MRTILQHECKPYPKPTNPLVLTTPYGHFVYEKIRINLEHENVILRRQAIAALLDLYVQQPEHVISSLSVGIVNSLVKLLADPDDDLRAQGCIALELIAKQPKGQTYLLPQNNNKHLARFLEVLDDPSHDVVVEALRLLGAIHLAHNEYAGTKRLVQLGVIPKYIEKIGDRDDAVCGTACMALSKCFEVKESFITILEHGGMEAITKSLKSRTDPMVIVEAAEVMSGLAFYGAGKAAAVQHRSVATLIPHLSNENISVKTAVTAALGLLTIRAEGKVQAIEAGAIDALLQALPQEDERDVLVNMVQCICSLAEHPDARPKFQTCIARLEELAVLAGDYAPLQQAVRRTVTTITWKPGETVASE